MLTSSSAGGTAIIWSGTRGENLQTLAHPGVRGAVFSPDGSLVLTSSRDGGTAKIWNVARGEPSQLSERPLQPFENLKP